MEKSNNLVRVRPKSHKRLKEMALAAGLSMTDYVSLLVDGAARAGGNVEIKMSPAQNDQAQAQGAGNNG